MGPGGATAEPALINSGQELLESLEKGQGGLVNQEEKMRRRGCCAGVRLRPREEPCGPLGSRIVSRPWASSGVTRRGCLAFVPAIFCLRRNPLPQQESRAREARKKRRLHAALSSPGDSRGVGGKRHGRSVDHPPAVSRTVLALGHIAVAFRS